MAERTQWCITGLLLYMTIISVSSGTVYIQSGSDITDCNMKCPGYIGKMELYRQCGEKEKTMIEYFPHYNYTNYHDPRIRLHTGSGCWKLTHARKDDSCVYEVWYYSYSDKDYLLSSTEIRVLDPVLIHTITKRSSWKSLDMTLSVHFSGEESAVTWEVDGEPLPERYRLIDDNRTLIIPGVQISDPERRFRVRITNPVSEEIREYRLEIGASDLSGRRVIFFGSLIGGVLILIVFVLNMHVIRKTRSRMLNLLS